MSAKLRLVGLTPRQAAAGRLRRARVARGWSQERAAHELGIGVRTLRDLELGRARMTALEALCVLEGFGKERRSDEALLIITGPTNRFGGGKPVARDTSGMTAPSSRAKHEGLATPVISASEQVVSPGSVGSLPAELGGARPLRRRAA
jgi:DNA-binding XRE family transcriptional regulator